MSVTGMSVSRSRETVAYPVLCQPFYDIGSCQIFIKLTDIGIG